MDRRKNMYRNSEFTHEKDRIVLYGDGNEVLAEITFREIEEGLVDINHTFVDESLRGQGIADKLMKELTHRLIDEGKRAVATCSYAESWLEKHEDIKKRLSRVKIQ